MDLVSVFPQQHILNYLEAYRWWTLDRGGGTGDVDGRQLSFLERATATMVRATHTLFSLSPFSSIFLCDSNVCVLTC